jgi:hypothetical protein
LGIRDLELSDIDAIVEILKLNGQYGFPEVDGPEVMKRVKASPTAVFLVYELDGKVKNPVPQRWTMTRLHFYEHNPIFSVDIIYHKYTGAV